MEEGLQVAHGMEAEATEDRTVREDSGMVEEMLFDVDFDDEREHPDWGPEEVTIVGNHSLAQPRTETE
eukprot:1871688-Rhodomonas_salina.2